MTIGFTGYSSLNGLGLITGTTSGYGGGYYGGLSNSTYVENAKTSIANNYALRTTQQSYSNLQNAETASLNLECQTIKDLLQDGRSDDALTAFNDLVDEMSGLSQYQGYDESYIKTMIQTQYATACNSTLLGDIAKYSDSSFVSGLKSSNPLSIFLCQTSSKADLKAEVTDKPTSNSDTFVKCTGAAAGGAGLAIAGKAAFGAKNVWKQAVEELADDALVDPSISQGLGAKLGKAAGLLRDNLKGCGKKVKWAAIIGAGIGLACVGAKWLYNKVTDNSASA